MDTEDVWEAAAEDDTALIGAEVIDSFSYVDAPPRPAMQPDAESTCCAECKAKWTFFNRRHHCRGCGRIICGTCSSERIVFPEEYGYSGAQRVCDVCYVLLYAKTTLRKSASAEAALQFKDGTAATRAAEVIREDDKGTVAAAAAVVDVPAAPIAEVIDVAASDDAVCAAGADSADVCDGEGGVCDAVSPVVAPVVVADVATSSAEPVAASAAAVCPVASPSVAPVDVPSSVTVPVDASASAAVADASVGPVADAQSSQAAEVSSPQTSVIPSSGESPAPTTDQ